MAGEVTARVVKGVSIIVSDDFDEGSRMLDRFHRGEKSREEVNECLKRHGLISRI